MSIQFTKAVRKAAPMLISIAGVSGSGKTYSAFLLAAGLAGPNGRVGMLDTENGRGAMYADSPGIVAALPNGFEIVQLDPPFSPERYIEVIKQAEQCGIDVLVIDSTSHEWEGIGGCCEIAETKKLRGMPNWSLAKMAHKRFLNHCLSSKMHIVFCLRARDKVKIAKDATGKEQVIPLGLMPITEKNFVFEMLVSLQLDEHTHFATPTKVPEPLLPLFPGGKLITKADGARIREWNQVGKPMEDGEQLQKRARAAAEDGTAAYVAFYGSLTAPEKKILFDSTHTENKKLAEQADRDRKAMESDGLSEDELAALDAKDREEVLAGAAK